MTFREFLSALGRVWHGPRVPPAPKPAPPPAPKPPAPAPGPPPGLGTDLLKLHNDFRAAHGLGALRLDPRLMTSALRESLDCARRSLLSHQSSDGKEPEDRISEAGYAWSWCGENIDEGTATPKDAFAAWVNSPKHLANILQPAFTDAGFAVAYDSRGAAYWTADFGRPA